MTLQIWMVFEEGCASVLSPIQVDDEGVVDALQ
jgi:hypothetical protein